MLIAFVVGKLVLIIKFTNFMDKSPTMVFLYMLQEVFIYLMFRLKYVEENKCLACLSCDLGMLYKFHFSNMLFCIFMLLVGCIDLGKTIFTGDGILQLSGTWMFLWELMSIVLTIMTIIVYWHFPRTVFNPEFLGDERPRNVGSRDGLTAVERYNLRRWEAYRASYPNFD